MPILCANFADRGTSYGLISFGVGFIIFPFLWQGVKKGYLRKWLHWEGLE